MKSWFAVRVQEVIQLGYRYFEDEEGNKSSIRLMSFITLMVVLGWGTLSLLRPLPDNGLTGNLLLFGFIFAFIPKAAQKIIERKMGLNGNGK